jgi:hypothetical protein
MEWNEINGTEIFLNGTQQINKNVTLTILSYLSYILSIKIIFILLKVIMVNAVVRIRWVS